MNELLPIVRRVRRPLVVVESVPDGLAKPPVGGVSVGPVNAKPERTVPNASDKQSQSPIENEQRTDQSTGAN